MGNLLFNNEVVMEDTQSKKIVIVNSSSNFEYRVDMLYKCLKNQGHSITVFASDFSHDKKKKRRVEKENYITIKTIPYKKNISIARIYSHINFSHKCKKILDNMKFDVLYIVVPPNSQAALARRYKKRDNVKIIMDIIDLWPESFPSTRTDKFPFTIWGYIRNKSLKYSDCIITECNLYKKKLNKYIAGKRITNIYWAHKETSDKIEPDYDNINSDGLHLLYLGAINNIIDISKIVGIVKMLSEKSKVYLDIVGSGEKKTEFIESLENAGVIVRDNGSVFDEKKKQAIMDSCHYGINIMKDTVCVGLSMKSIDYLKGGLPIINNLNADIGDIISKNNCGVNIYDDAWDADIYDKEKIHDMKINARRTFDEYFSEEVFNEKIKELGI
ncbi:MAG: glycosyltransferase [Lachnospiraceae bacterium]|nr:glycosyltransferase [Lachnospiraceae bacterium]